MFPAGDDVLEIAGILRIGGNGRIFEQIGEAQNRIQRRPQLVADICQKFVFQPIRFIKRHIALFQLSQLQIQTLVNRTKLIFPRLQVRQHPVERL